MSHSTNNTLFFVKYYPYFVIFCRSFATLNDTSSGKSISSRRGVESVEIVQRAQSNHIADSLERLCVLLVSARVFF